MPNKRAKDDFKQQYEDEIIYRFGETEKRFKFDKMLESFYSTLNLQELSNDKMSVKTNKLLSVYKSEKFRQEKISEENKPKS